MSNRQIDPWMAFVERVGIPTAILASAGLMVYGGVIHPVAESYRHAIDQVGIATAELSKEVQRDNAFDDAAVNEFRAAIMRVEAKLDELLGRRP